MDAETLATEITEYALDHYDRGGWDFLVETVERAELVKVLTEAKCKTLKSAVTVVRREFALGLLDERRREIQNTAW